MADNVINLNRARKDRARAEAAAKAGENRARFGQTKGEKAKAQSMAEKLKQALDAAKRDPDRRG
jgi:hypothetical protein